MSELITNHSEWLEDHISSEDCREPDPYIQVVVPLLLSDNQGP